MANIGVIGSGYVGLTTSVVLANLGNQVTAVDSDATKVSILKTGHCPFYEPGLEELLELNVKAQRLRFTTSHAEAVSDADFVFICVNTPMGTNGGADMNHVWQATREIGHALCSERRTIVVNKSTMPIGSGDAIHELSVAETGDAARFVVVSNPEFLREGSALHDMLHPDRIVLGSSDRAAADAVAQLYRAFSAPHIITDIRTAEMIKYASNAFLATRISFINEIGFICEAVGADVREVAAGMGLDKRIGPHFLHAGVGFGGSCFPKDIQALRFMAEEAGCHPQLLRSVIDINQKSRRNFVRKLHRVLGKMEGTIITVWGLAFKPDTDDLREAPSLDIIRDLQMRGAAVRAFDPVAMDAARALLPGVTFCETVYEAAVGADAIALITEWNEFRGLDLSRVRDSMRRPVLIDGRNLYDSREMTALGFTYRGVGVPATQQSVGATRPLIAQSIGS